MSSMHCCADIRKKWSNLFLFFIAALLLAGCGGGGGGGGSSSPAASTLSGVAAVGTPIVNGNINIICAAGGALAPAITSSSGSWQVTLSGQTLPCAVQVSGGTINGVANTTPYHSIAITTGTVNITPLTDLTVANLIGTATPNTWFAGLSANPSPLTTITQTQVDTALTNLSTALSVIPLFTSTTNPITTDFTPNAGNILDDMLTALQAAMASTNTNYSSLLSNASANGFTAPAGFGSAMTTAFMGTATVKNTRRIQV